MNWNRWSYDAMLVFWMVATIMNNWSVRQSISLYFSVVLGDRRMLYNASAIVWSQWESGFHISCLEYNSHTAITTSTIASERFAERQAFWTIMRRCFSHANQWFPFLIVSHGVDMSKTFITFIEEPPIYTWKKSYGTPKFFRGHTLN